MQRGTSEPPDISSLSDALDEHKSDSSKPQSPSATQKWVDNTELRSTTDSLGRITIEDEQSKYHGGSHWAAILESVSARYGGFCINSLLTCFQISGLKESIDYREWPNDESIKPSISTNHGPALLIGSVRQASRAESELS